MRSLEGRFPAPRLRSPTSLSLCTLSHPWLLPTFQGPPQSPERLPVTFIKAQLMTERDVQAPDPDRPFPKLLGGRRTSELSPSDGGPENLH